MRFKGRIVPKSADFTSQPPPQPPLLARLRHAGTKHDLPFLAALVEGGPCPPKVTQHVFDCRIPYLVSLRKVHEYLAFPFCDYSVTHSHLEHHTMHIASDCITPHHNHDHKVAAYHNTVTSSIALKDLVRSSGPVLRWETLIRATGSAMVPAAATGSTTATMARATRKTR